MRERLVSVGCSGRWNLLFGNLKHRACEAPLVCDGYVCVWLFVDLLPRFPSHPLAVQDMPGTEGYRV